MRKAVRRILVVVDPAKSRDAAFDRALALARGWNAGLYLLHACPPRRASHVSTASEDLELGGSEGARSRLSALVRSAEGEGVQVRAVTAEGLDRARDIAAHAHLVMADLIVIPRDFGSSRLWRVPRVAASLGRSAPVPVLIVPPQRAAIHPAGPMFKKIVVAVDFTVASAVALRAATDLIAQGDGRGTVVHALPYASPMVFSGSEAFREIEYLRGHTVQVEARLRGTLPATARHLLKARVVIGEASQAILDVAAEVDADLVVMGVPSRDGGELLFGSTFRRVVSQSLRPILAVPVVAGGYRWAGDLPAHLVNESDLRAA